MDYTVKNSILNRIFRKKHTQPSTIKNLLQAQISQTYTIREIRTQDEALENFLFTLGCYAGEKVTVISILAEIYVIAVKDARYSIDQDLAAAILI